MHSSVIFHAVICHVVIRHAVICRAVICYAVICMLDKYLILENTTEVKTGHMMKWKGKAILMYSMMKLEWNSFMRLCRLR